MTKAINLNIGESCLVGEQTTGSGPALVFLHAGVADKRMWASQLTAFGNDYHAIAYDRRGFGETTSADVVFANVEDLRQMLDHLGISTVTFVGCSQGGRVAIDFALAYPQRVTAFVLIATAVSGAPMPNSFLAEIQVHVDALDKADDADDLEQINAIEAHLWLDGPTSSAGRVGGDLRELFLDMNRIALLMPELTKEIDPPSAYENVSDLQMPTLILSGELDFPHVKARCQYLAETIPAARWQQLANVAHLPSFEQPELVNKLLRDFFEQNLPLSESA